MSISYLGKKTWIVCDRCEKHEKQSNLLKDIFVFKNWTVEKVYLPHPIWTTMGEQFFYNEHYCPGCTKRKIFKVIPGGI